MNNGLDKIRIIDIEQLNNEFYFQSLIEQAHDKGLLCDNDIERIQYECLNLLAYKTECYNSGDSSSIRVEKAQSIMSSNLFTIGLWLKTYTHPDDAITALQNEPINEIYQKGRKRIDTMLTAAKTVHEKLLKQIIDTKNVYYRSTIEGGIKGFFKLYYPDFESQEIHITADYPVCNPIVNLAGIEFISAYLNNLYYENLFCCCFSTCDIHHLLCGYEEDYQGLLINIYEPVLITAIGCSIIGADIYKLDITKQGIEYLQQFFHNMPKSEIIQTMQDAVNKIVSVFQLSNGLTRYIQSSLYIIANKIDTALQDQKLNHIFFTPAFPENDPKIIFSFGEKMDNEQYRKIIDEIGQCRYLQDKIAIIKKYIRSLADFEDVLLDAEISQEEIQAILRELNLTEIAALSKKYQLMSNTDTYLREREKILSENLQSFILTLQPKQQELMAQAIKAIQEE